MTPEISEQQRQALKDHPDDPLVVLDPATQSRYILIPADTFERVRALLTDEEFRVEEAYPLMDEVAATEGWNDPTLDVYEKLDPRTKP